MGRVGGKETADIDRLQLIKKKKPDRRLYYSSLCRFAKCSLCDARKKEEKIKQKQQRFERLLKQKPETEKSDPLEIYDKHDFKTFFHPID